MQLRRTTILLATGVGLGLLVFSLTRRPSGMPRFAVPGATSTVAGPKLPAPRLGLTAPPVGVPPEELTPPPVAVRLWERLKDDDWPRLDPASVEVFLAQRNRSAEALLTAAETTGDKGYLREAMERFPDDPRVAYAAYFFGGPLLNDAPSGPDQPAGPERRRWLERFKAAAPDNALPHYLAASDDFKAGRTDAAVTELLAAAGKPLWDPALEAIQNREEAYRAAGMSEAEAKAAAYSTQFLPHLPELKRLGLNLVELANAYRQAGDAASAGAALQLAVELGRELDRSAPFLISDLVAVAIEINALKAADPAAPLGSQGQTVQGRLDELQRRREELKALGQQWEGLLPTLSEQDLIGYFDRAKLLGEPNAIRWLLQMHGRP